MSWGDWQWEALARWGAFVLLTLIALALAAVLRRISWSRTVAHLPEPAERSELLACARTLRGSGASLDECIADLVRRGAQKNVARSLVLDMELEQPADVANPRRFTWRDWSFAYPGNWRTSAVVPRLGESAGITVEAIGGGMFMLLALDGDGVELNKLIADQEAQIRLPERTAVDQWGSLRGEGTRFRGTHARMKLPVDLLVFRPTTTEASFALIEWFVRDEAELIQPGLSLIRSSFTRTT